MNQLTTTTRSTAAANAALGHRIYAAFAAGDVEALCAELHPDVVLDVPGDNPLAGRWTGIDGVLSFLATARSLATEDVQLLDVLAGHDHVAGLCLVTGRRVGRPVLENRTVHLFDVGDDGRVAAIRFHNADQPLVDAFWR